MTPASPYDVAHLADAELLVRLESLVAHDHETTAQILAHIAEVDVRRLYREAACASTFSYCTEILHLAEATAYKRITAARAARRFPLIFDLVASGMLHLSAVCLLAPQLRPDNAETLLRAAVHRSKREVEELVAAHFPKPDVPALVRRLPAPAPAPAAPAPAAALAAAAAALLAGAPGALPVAAPAPAMAPEPAPLPTSASAAGPAAGPAAAPAAAPPRPPVPAVAPLAAERYKFQFTGSRGLRDKLREVQDLLRPAAAAGDLGVVVEQAVDLLLRELRRRKYGATPQPRPAPRRRAPARRPRRQPRRRAHLANATRREVARRDERRCAYVDARTGKRCTATSNLHYHHRHARGRGGGDDAANLALFCAVHDGLCAEQDYGAEVIARTIAAARARHRGRAGERGARGAPAGPPDPGPVRAPEE
jgi:hypothetical protein